MEINIVLFIPYNKHWVYKHHDVQKRQIQRQRNRILRIEIKFRTNKMYRNYVNDQNRYPSSLKCQKNLMVKISSE